MGFGMFKLDDLNSERLSDVFLSDKRSHFVIIFQASFSTKITVDTSDYELYQTGLAGFWDV